MLLNSPPVTASPVTGKSRLKTIAEQYGDVESTYFGSRSLGYSISIAGAFNMFNINLIRV